MMKWLVVLIVLLCVLLALWYFRDDITGARLRFVEREAGGARFKVPKWRESVFHDDPDGGRLILKHKRNEKRIVYLAWQRLEELPMQDARTTAAAALMREYRRILAELTASALAEMTDTSVSVKEAPCEKKVGGQDATLYMLTFSDEKVGQGLLWIWSLPPDKRCWCFAIVDDDAEEAERIAHEFLGSFTAGARPVEETDTRSRKLVFDAPSGWRVHDEAATSIAYVSPDEDALLELHYGKRTSRSRMTTEYAQSLAASMIEATGATWQPQATTLKNDSRLDATVAVLRGTARIADDQRAYDIRLWIAPSTSLLYVAALSAFDQPALDRFSTVFDRITIAD